MYEYERLDKILNYLSEQKNMTVRVLAQKLFVSEATVRRDLNVLEKQGQVRRVFGGAMLLEIDQFHMPFYGHTTVESSKEDMALKACELINHGDTLMLDASSTVNALLRHLKRFKNLTIITNSAVTSAGLQDLDAKVFVTGGYMPKNSQGYVGNYAADMARNFNADFFFFSCGGITQSGAVTEVAYEEMSIRKVMMRQAKKKILMCDSGKFGLQHSYNLCSMDDIDVLISDAPFTGVGREKQYM